MSRTPYAVRNWYSGLSICTACWGVGGTIAPDSRRKPVKQRCRCSEPAVSEMWVTYGIMYCGTLCHCCGQVVLEMRSMFSVWFCDGCKREVGLLNGRLGRCAVPIGSTASMPG
jgi:hypothetical protein